MTRSLRFLLSLPPHKMVLGLGLLAFMALVSSFVAQYAFSITPCDLCWYQRDLYGGITMAAVIAARKQNLTPWILWGQLGLLLLGMGLSLYHVGLEHQWWTPTLRCFHTYSLDVGVSLPLKKIPLAQWESLWMAPPKARCDLINWSLMGLSATVWNLLLQATLSLIAQVGLRRRNSVAFFKKWEK